MSQTEDRTEARRTNRVVLCDYQPSGLCVRNGEKIGLRADGLANGYDIFSMIGFKPLWGD